jgi:hypothetical protein
MSDPALLIRVGATQLIQLERKGERRFAGTYRQLLVNTTDVLSAFSLVFMIRLLATSSSGLTAAPRRRDERLAVICRMCSRKVELVSLPHRVLV